MLATAAPAFFPVLSDGMRGIFARFTGGAGARPQNADEYIRVMEAETTRLRALAEMENVGDTYKWVNAVRALQRPFAIALILASYSSVMVFNLEVDAELSDYLAAFASSSVFYLLGDRTNVHSRNRGER